MQNKWARKVHHALASAQKGLDNFILWLFPSRRMEEHGAMNTNNEWPGESATISFREARRVIAIYPPIDPTEVSAPLNRSEPVEARRNNSLACSGAVINIRGALAS